MRSGLAGFCSMMLLRLASAEQEISYYDTQAECSSGEEWISNLHWLAMSGSSFDGLFSSVYLFF